MRALKVVSAARASGHDAQPSEVATQAIRIITSTDLAPLKAPAIARPRREEASQNAQVGRATPTADTAPGETVLDAAAGSAWRPKTMPVPAYALKASVRQQTARQLSEDDYAASSQAAHQAAQSEAKTDGAIDDVPRTGALDAILAKRRQASA
jgi:hypothetical protein